MRTYVHGGMHTGTRMHTHTRSGSDCLTQLRLLQLQAGWFSACLSVSQVPRGSRKAARETASPPACWGQRKWHRGSLSVVPAWGSRGPVIHSWRVPSGAALFPGLQKPVSAIHYLMESCLAGVCFMPIYLRLGEVSPCRVARRGARI